jgi:hypothetical protein
VKGPSRHKLLVLVRWVLVLLLLVCRLTL